MGININDLDNSSNPRNVSLLSGNEIVLDNLRELSDEELKITGGETESNSVVITNKGSLGKIAVYGDGVTVYTSGFPIYEDSLTIYNDGSPIYDGSFPALNSKISFDLSTNTSTSSSV